MTYQEQLDHPKWQLRRLKIIKRDKGTCQACGCKEIQLHVHHKHYISGRMAWEYQDWELTTLCKVCHAKLHKKPEPPTLEQLAADYFNAKSRYDSALNARKQSNTPRTKDEIERGRSIFSRIRKELEGK